MVYCNWQPSKDSETGKSIGKKNYTTIIVTVLLVPSTPPPPSLPPCCSEFLERGAVSEVNLSAGVQAQVEEDLKNPSRYSFRAAQVCTYNYTGTACCGCGLSWC